LARIWSAHGHKHFCANINALMAAPMVADVYEMPNMLEWLLQQTR
jgi:hypothetical protein